MTKKLVYVIRSKQINHSIERFLKEFMFQLSEDELNVLRSQFVTANISTMTRTNPFVFTGIVIKETIIYYFTLIL